MNLTGKIVLITGGSLGIGKACARLMKEKGARVIITGRNESRLQATATELDVFPIVADVSQAADVARTYEIVQAEFGGLDVLINNAGTGGSFRLLEEVDMKEVQSLFNTNVMGAIMMGQGAARIFVKQKSGAIVNIGSTASLNGFARGTAYAASKFALRALSQCWQHELRKYNVRVMQVNPSEVATAFGDPTGREREAAPNKLSAQEIAHAIVSGLEMDDRGFLPEMTIWATNPF